MSEYIIALLIVVVLGWFMLRIIIPLTDKNLSVTSLIVFYIMRKFGFPVFYIFLISIAYMQYKSDVQFNSFKDFLMHSVLVFPFVLVVTYGLSGLVLHWMLNDILIKAFSNGKTIDGIDKIGKMQKSIQRWAFLHRLLFGARGLNIQDVFAAIGIDSCFLENLTDGQNQWENETGSENLSDQKKD